MRIRFNVYESLILKTNVHFTFTGEFVIYMQNIRKGGSDIPLLFLSNFSRYEYNCINLAEISKHLQPYLPVPNFKSNVKG